MEFFLIELEVTLKVLYNRKHSYLTAGVFHETELFLRAPVRLDSISACIDLAIGVLPPFIVVEDNFADSGIVDRVLIVVV